MRLRDFLKFDVYKRKQISTGYAPIFLKELRTRKMGLQNQLEPCTDISISEITENRIHYSIECRNKIFKEAEDNTKQAQEKQKTNYEKRHHITRHTFKIHDKVLLQNMRRKTKKGTRRRNG